MGKTVDHSARAHALLSASSSSRWLACPPSAMAATLYPSTDTVFTREGTLAHEVAELVVSQRLADPTIKMVGYVDDDTGEEATQEMIDCAEEYADYIQSLIQDDAASVLLEQRLDFSPWVPGGFGTGDCLIIQGNHLDVIDYKFGAGVTVAAEGNSQMRLYGLGAWHEFGYIYNIETVALHIFQPRKNNIAVERLTVGGLLAWGAAAHPVAEQAAKGEGEYKAGDHCRFCPHAGSCPALAEACSVIVENAGGAYSVRTLAPFQVADILAQESMISSWLKAVKERALSDLLNGDEVPGYKVVAGRALRRWADDLEAMDALLAAGLQAGEVTKTELLSPAALEKAIGKKKVAELVGGHILSSTGAPTVVPLSDKRPVFDRLAEARKDFT